MQYLKCSLFTGAAFGHLNSLICSLRHPLADVFRWMMMNFSVYEAGLKRAESAGEWMRKIAVALQYQLIVKTPGWKGSTDCCSDMRCLMKVCFLTAFSPMMTVQVLMLRRSVNLQSSCIRLIVLLNKWHPHGHCISGALSSTGC